MATIATRRASGRVAHADTISPSSGSATNGSDVAGDAFGPPIGLISAFSSGFAVFTEGSTPFARYKFRSLSEGIFRCQSLSAQGVYQTQTRGTHALSALCDIRNPAQEIINNWKAFNGSVGIPELRPNSILRNLD